MTMPKTSPTLRPLVGASPPMAALRVQLRRYARSAAPVLIRGETGVGKDLVAHGLHAASSRAASAFVPVNCGAIPRDLVEAELFGNVPGAFTGARSRDGWFRRAHGGTLFLDEIGDMPQPAQVVLLRVLETGRVWPIGADRPLGVDVRLACATHRNLEDMVEQRLFRRDLYHRLAGLTICVPPLRDRMSDLPALVTHFFGSQAHRVSTEAWRRLESHRWPGNVRELKNVLNAAFVEAEGAPIGAAHLRLRPGPRPRTLDQNPVEPLQTYLARYVLDVFGRCEGNVRATARCLQISPTTVYRYLSIRTPDVLRDPRFEMNPG